MKVAILVGTIVLIVFLLFFTIIFLLSHIVTFFSLWYSLLVSCMVILYWYVDAQYRRIAKGFHSCVRVPSSYTTTSTSKDRRESIMKKWNSSQSLLHKTNHVDKTVLKRSKTNAVEELPEKMNIVPVTPLPSVSTKVGAMTEPVPTDSPDNFEPMERKPRHSFSESDSPIRPSRKLLQRQRASSYQIKSNPTYKLSRSNMDRHRMPPISAPLRQAYSERGSFGSVTSEKSAFEEAMESNGYWIGDFRKNYHSPPSSIGSPVSSTPRRDRRF